MNKRIEGTFVDYEEVLRALQEKYTEGYSAKQLLVLTRNEKGERLKEESEVEVMITNSHDESLWDKIVSIFTVNLDDDDEEEVDEEDVFEDYGLDEDTYERFEEALENNEYLLLIDDAPPEDNEPADFLVRDGIIPEEDQTMKTTKPDWADDDRTTDGDLGRHSVEEEKNDDAPTSAEENPDLLEDTTGQPINAADPEGDPTMADENQKMPEMQFDDVESHPETEDEGTQVSTDPFGGDTQPVGDNEGGEQVEPDYDETDDEKPAL